MIDAHLHIHPRFPVEELIRYLDEQQIETCWLFTWEESDDVPWPYVPLTVESVYEAYQKYPRRIIPMYAPDPLQENCVERFRKYHQLGFRGCGELKSAIHWENPRLTPLLTYLNDFRLPLTFHMEEARREYIFRTGSRLENLVGRISRGDRWGGTPRKMLEAVSRLCPPLQNYRESLQYTFPGYLMDMAGLERALQKYPAIQFVGHGPYFWKCIADPPGALEYPATKVERKGIIWRLLEEYPNLYADLSGRSGYTMLNRDPDTAKKLLNKFSHKLLYGSDNFFGEIKEFLDSLRLTPSVYQQIYEDNAQCLLDNA